MQAVVIGSTHGSASATKVGVDAQVGPHERLGEAVLAAPPREAVQLARKALGRQVPLACGFWLIAIVGMAPMTYLAQCIYAPMAGATKYYLDTVYVFLAQLAPPVTLAFGLLAIRKRHRAAFGALALVGLVVTAGALVLYYFWSFGSFHLGVRIPFWDEFFEFAWRKTISLRVP